MKKLLNQFSKIITFIIVITLTVISLSACNKSTETASILSTNIFTPNTSDSISPDDLIADKISDNSSTFGGELVVDENTEVSENNIKNIVSGNYKLQLTDINYTDINYTIKEDFLKALSTTDLNGAYETIKTHGFYDFKNSIFTYTLNDTTYSRAININIDADSKTLTLSNLYFDDNNNFNIIEEETYNFKIEDGKLVSNDESIKILFDESTGTISLLYQFSYIDAETNETIYVPAYVKINLIYFN